MDTLAELNASQEAVAAHMGDPSDAVYARLFNQYPEMEDLFVLDTDRSARGHMMNEALETLLDLFGDNKYGSNFIEIELNNHDGFGVPPDVFVTFFTTIRDTFRDGLGAHWTPAMDAAWTDALTRTTKLMADSVPAWKKVS